MADSYREDLVKTRRESQTLYDKAVIILSGGALGLSLSFVKELLGAHQIYFVACLMIAWALWAISCGLVLYSHFASVTAHDEAIAALDDNRLPSKAADKLTALFNVLSGVGFLIGLLFFALFAYANLAIR